jgi:hypothetical protein
MICIFLTSSLRSKIDFTTNSKFLEAARRSY